MFVGKFSLTQLKQLGSKFSTVSDLSQAYDLLKEAIENKKIKPESIYLFCHSQEDLMKLKEMLYEKILEIDTGLEVEFRQFAGEDPQYKTKMSHIMDPLL